MNLDALRSYIKSNEKDEDRAKVLKLIQSSIDETIFTNSNRSNNKVVSRTIKRRNFSNGSTSNLMFIKKLWRVPTNMFYRLQIV